VGMTPGWYFSFAILIPMWSYASNPNTMSEIVVFLRVQITPKCHWEWHKTPTEKQASYLVRVSKWHPYLFSLEAINSHQRFHHKKSSKKKPASPPEPCRLDLHRGGCSLPRHSANEPKRHSILATPSSWPHYHANLMASAITSSSAAVTRPGTRLPPPTAAQSQDRSSPTCTSPSQLVAFRPTPTYFILPSPEDNDSSKSSSSAADLQTYTNTLRCDYNKLIVTVSNCIALCTLA
jgi:hypothetical protein